MKKFIFAVFALLTICACETKKNTVSELNVETAISLDREDMYKNYGDDYRWFETTVVLKNHLDSEDVSMEIESVTNLFQYVIESGQSADVLVITYTHDKNGTNVQKVHDFVLDDEVLNDKQIVLRFEDAYSTFMQSNTIRPHSRYVVLRKEVGMIEANTQYIFGNSECQVYVDAVTGKVSTLNPAFPENSQLNYAFSW